MQHPHFPERKTQLQEFAAYARKLKGDEKGEAQVFLDRLFRAFGRQGYKEAGAVLEQRVKNVRGGTSFADLVWKPIVLIEMKKRGEDLSRHLLQAFKYWEELVPGRPRYVVLCNFDEFRVYDFDQDIHQPQDTVTIEELPDRYGPLNFLWPTNEPAHFQIDREKATRGAADLLAAVYRRLRARSKVGPVKAQRFVLQALVCLFSEDIGLLPKHFFKQLLDDCTDPPKAFDLLNNLFTAMNEPAGRSGGRYAVVDYFNGGIFSQPAAIELDFENEVALLKRAATYNWAHVSPDIFGTIFQHSMDEKERHALGAHYTSQADIMRIVGPTIVHPFTTAIDNANSVRELTAIRGRLTTLRVLDPACGSGNFLYIAYREMRRLEAAILAKQAEVSGQPIMGKAALAAVSPKQFFGMDIIPFAVDLAKVTLSLAPKLASDELHTPEKTLPLDNLEKNIVVKDALIEADGLPTPWPSADVIIGNPPFLDARKMTMERGRKYTKAIEKAYPDIARRADQCVYWFRRAHDHLPICTPSNPYSGRAGLVGTQNIRNNEAREGGLDHIVKSGTLIEAVENQPWSGEANVHVSIANWVKVPEAKVIESALLVPSPRRLWSKIDPTITFFEDDANIKNKVVITGKRGRIRQDKSYELGFRPCVHINSALSDATDVSLAMVLQCNRNPKVVFEGVQTGHDGFVVTEAEARDLISKNQKYRKFIHPFINGRDLLSGVIETSSEFLIDLTGLDALQVAALPDLLRIPQARVLPDWRKNAKNEEKETGKTRGEHQNRLDAWWELKRPRLDLRRALGRVSRYVACSAVMKRPIFAFLAPTYLPTNAIKAFVFDDDYSFGILQSNAHWQWFITKCSKLTERFRYTPESVFDTFPWPQSPSNQQVTEVAKAARAVRQVREGALEKLTGGLRALYRTLELPGKNPLKDAHAALDAAVLDTYGFDKKKDLLAQLLELNLSVARAIERGEKVVGPGIPPSFKNPTKLITSDCIQAERPAPAPKSRPSRRKPK